MKHCDTPVLCAIAAAVLAAACRLHGEVVCPDKDRDGEMDGVVSFHCRTEPYFFMLDDADDPWRVEFADERNVPPLFPGCRVKVRGVFPKWSATPRLRTATVEVTGRENAPPYLEMTPAELYATDSDGEQGRRERLRLTSELHDNFQQLLAGCMFRLGAAMCRFAYSLDGTRWSYAPNHFTAREGKWIGATVGIYALSPHSCRDRGWIDADWFRIDR